MLKKSKVRREGVTERLQGSSGKGPSAKFFVHQRGKTAPLGLGGRRARKSLAGVDRKGLQGALKLKKTPSLIGEKEALRNLRSRGGAKVRKSRRRYM